MTLNLKTGFLFTALFLTALSSSAQEKNYGILTITKEAIKNYYDNGVDFIVFKYKKPLFASYKLEGTPFDASGKPVLSSFKPKKVNRHGKQKLGNFYKGILILSVDSMKLHGIDGTFDIFFYPLNNHDIEGANYVSYLINKTPDSKFTYSENVTGLRSHGASGPNESPAPPPFSPLGLNPSPPYRSGGR
ncbi:MAG: hypothetical protein ABI683_04295 [Ginsengibacter sp.]